MGKPMIQRVAYGTLAITTLVLLFVLDAEIAKWAGGQECGLRLRLGPGPDGWFGDLLHHGSVVPLLLLAVSLRGAVELRRMAAAKAIRIHSTFAFVMVSLIVATPWLCASGIFGDGIAAQEGLYWPLVWLAVTVAGAGSLQVLRGDPTDAFRDTGTTIMLVVYVGFLTSFGVMLRSGIDTPHQEGVWLLLITVLVTKASDIGAYFVGSAIGRHKLSPGISPGKSVEGAIGGLLASAMTAVAFASAVSVLKTLHAPEGAVLFADELTRSFRMQAAAGDSSPIIRAVIFGVAMSVAGQLGDLFESCLKRDAGSKDSGRIMPQYGGILDLIDSPVFSMPVAWFLLTAVWHVV